MRRVSEMTGTLDFEVALLNMGNLTYLEASTAILMNAVLEMSITHTILDNNVKIKCHFFQFVQKS